MYMGMWWKVKSSPLPEFMAVNDVSSDSPVLHLKYKFCKEAFHLWYVRIMVLWTAMPEKFIQCYSQSVAWFAYVHSMALDSMNEYDYRWQFWSFF